MNLEKTISDDQIRLIWLPRLRVASARFFGPDPEREASFRLREWMRERGVPLETSRYYGFNNPDPTPASPNYGYEQLVVLDDEYKNAVASSQVAIKEMPIGLYAVYRHFGSAERLPASWCALIAWVQTSKYRLSASQYLEEIVSVAEYTKDEPNPENMVFDLHIAISE